jgi:hypothetical protein
VPTVINCYIALQVVVEGFVDQAGVVAFRPRHNFFSSMPIARRLKQARAV